MAVRAGRRRADPPARERKGERLGALGSGQWRVYAGPVDVCTGDLRRDMTDAAAPMA